MGKIFFAVLLLTAVLAPARADAAFGAIAYSPSTGSYGWSNGRWSRWEAEQAAVAACSTYAFDCLAAVWVSNGCAALSAGGGRYSTGWGATADIAASYANSTCGWGCRSIAWVCSG